MTFTAAVGSNEAEMIEVAQGSHVFCSGDDLYVEWADLTTEQQAMWLKARDILEKALDDAKAVLHSAGPKDGEPEAVTE